MLLILYLQYSFAFLSASTITGVDLIIDDTPEVIILSSFDPLRREIAKVTLEGLIKEC